MGVPKVKLTQIYTEREHTEENNQDQLEGFNMCGDDDLDYETGGACLWVINQERFDALPAGVTDQTDCTLNYEENNGCQFADEDGGNLDDDATIADEQGWLFDQSSGKTELARTLVDGEWEYLCCRNCQNSDGDAPACKDNYDATKPDDE